MMDNFLSMCINKIGECMRKIEESNKPAYLQGTNPELSNNANEYLEQQYKNRCPICGMDCQSP